MAICRYCYQDTLGGAGCVDDALHLDGEIADRIRFGLESLPMDALVHCGLCGTNRGSHHHHGCLAERCTCGGYAARCSCVYDEDSQLDWESVDDELAQLLSPPIEIVLAEDGTVTSHLQKLPLESVTKPLQLRYQPILEDLKAWGHDYDEYPDVGQLLSLGLYGLAPFLNDHGKFALRRPSTSVAMNRIRLLVEDLDGGVSALMADSMAALLTSLFELGRLDPNSDPLDILLEPLRCHYGLGGRSVLDAAGTRPCRCFVNFDPFQPSSLVLVRVQSGQVVEALAPQGTLDSLLGPEPLDLFVSTLDEIDSNVAGFGLVDLRVLGVIPATESSPRFWVYGRVEVPGPRENLILDDDGVPHLALLDDSSKTGFRWTESLHFDFGLLFSYNPWPGTTRSQLGS